MAMKLFYVKILHFLGTHVAYAEVDIECSGSTGLAYCKTVFGNGKRYSPVATGCHK